MRTSSFWRRTLQALPAVVALSAPPAAWAASPAAPLPALVVFGDSLSAGYGLKPGEGWVDLLARRLAREAYGYRVVNASVSGETSAGGLARLPRVLAANSPALLIVELGANDGLRGLPPADMERNLTAIVTLARTAHARVLLVGMRIPGNYGPEYTERFAAVFGSIASAQKLPLVPFLLSRIALDESQFQGDGLHPIASAEPEVLDTVWPVLAPLLAAPRHVAAGGAAH
jgi:acyl-CoA thioesterase I